MKTTKKQIVMFLLLLALYPGVGSPPAQADAKAPSPANNRVASLYISQDFINEQIKAHSKSELIKDMAVALDEKNGQIYLRGTLQVPIEELHAVNLDPKLGAFHFQLTIKPETTKKGYLILEFPLDKTYFYPSVSKDPVHDRVIIPVQMLSLALASIRGYLAALSGDFSGFDRRTKKLEALKSALDHSIDTEKNSDARDEMKTQRQALEIQLAAVPVERKQLENLSKEFEHIMGFTGEKELNINQDLGARRNALILKIKLSQLAPYLDGVELGGLRVVHDKKDGGGQNYVAVDINSVLSASLPPRSGVTPATRPPEKIAPSLIMRLNQALFESESLRDEEKKAGGSKIRDLDFQLKDDGLHVSGKYHAFIITVSFDTIVDFVSTEPDVFEVRVRDIKVGGIDFEFLSKLVLESLRKRLDHTLSHICTFTYVAKEKGTPPALRVTVDNKALVPAFPDLHLVNVDIREQEFLLKIGRL